MGVVKRYIHQTLQYSTPNLSSDTDRFIILRNLSQANNTGVIGQISALFEYTNEIFSEIVEEASATAERIKSLSQRVESLYESLPTAETETPMKQQLTNLGVSYSNKSPEDACQFLPEHRVPSIIHQYEECMPPPNLSLLDPYAGESCLKKYTNPMFFLESWVEEQNRMYQEAKKKRAARRRVRNTAQTTGKIAVKHVELRRNKYNAMGQEFSSPVQSRTASDGATITPQPVAADPLTVTKQPSLTTPVEEPVKPKRDKRTKEKEKKTKEKKPKKTRSKKSKEKLPPPPTDAAPPPPVDEAPAIEPTTAPVKTTPVPAPEPVNVPPPPPPPANIPPPPPPTAKAAPKVGASGLADQLGGVGLKTVSPAEQGEKKPVEKRSALLSAIQAGTQLKKVDTEALLEAKKKEDSGGFNVAKILARRAAMEFSDEEEGSFDDDDWEP